MWIAAPHIGDVDAKRLLDSACIDNADIAWDKKIQDGSSCQASLDILVSHNTPVT